MLNYHKNITWITINYYNQVMFFYDNTTFYDISAIESIDYDYYR